MYNRKKNRSLVFLFFCFFTNLIYSQDDDLYKYSAGDFEIVYYGKGFSYLIPHTARSFNNAFRLHKHLFDYKSENQISIFLSDFSDFGNGGASSIPFNFITSDVNVFDNIYDYLPSNERMQWLASHELTHIIVTDKPYKNEKFYRSLFFGKPMNDNSNPLSMVYSYLATPRWYCPRWYQEGIAIFMETFLNAGSGRLLGGYDEMVFRTMVLENSYFYEPIGLEIEGTTADFMVGANAYLYGTRFVSFLAAKYGKDKLMEFYNRDSESNRYFVSQFEKVFGTDILDEWHNWIKFEKEFQQHNIDRIKSYPVTKHRTIGSQVLGSASRQFYDKKRNSIICAVNYPGELAHIAEIDINTSKSRTIAQVFSPRMYFVTNIAYDESTGNIYYTDNNLHYRDLLIVNIETGKIIKKLDFQRFGDPAFNKTDKSLWGVRNYNGRTIISRILPPYDEVEEFITVPFGYNFFDLDISPDGKLLSGVFSDPNGRQKIVIYNLKDIVQGKNEFTEIYEFEDNSASNFCFSLDGKWLYGTSYYTGVSNIFRINLESKEPEILTNSLSGYFRPVQISQDSMIAYNYTSQGLQPVVIKIDTVSAEAIKLFGMRVLEKNPEIRDWKLGSISSITFDSSEIRNVVYNPMKELKFRYIIPIVEAYKDFPSFGFQSRLMDQAIFNLLDLKLSYSPNNLIPEKERIHFNMTYYYFYWEMNAYWNKSNFYDFFGPTKRSREGGMFSLKFNDFLLPNRSPEKWDYSIGASYYFDLKTLPQYQEIRSNSNWLFNSKFNMTYSLLRKSLGAIEEESGMKYDLILDNDYAQGENFFNVLGQAAFGTLLHMRNSSLWLRLYGGKSFGNEDSPFNYFYFGGFGNNYLDNNEVQRYRDFISLPGTRINSIMSNSFAKATLEWNLPPIRFKKLGFMPAYITYTRLSLFSTALAYDLKNPSLNNSIYSTGAQVDFEIAFFYLLKVWFSAGYARSYNHLKKPGDEFMLSLKF